MKTIKQKFNYSCGVASIAMMVGKSHEEVRKKCFPNHNFNVVGITIKDIFKALIMYGIIPYANFGYPEEDNTMNNVPGILFVPSLNSARSQHYIFYNGKDIYDPNQESGLNIYTKLNFAPICHIVDAKKKEVKNRIRKRIKKLNKEFL